MAGNEEDKEKEEKKEEEKEEEKEEKEEEEEEDSYRTVSSITLFAVAVTGLERSLPVLDSGVYNQKILCQIEPRLRLARKPIKRLT